MAYSYAESTASGSTAIFTVPFEYINKAYVHVSVNGVLVDDALLTWNSSTEIVLPTTPAAGATVRRYRTTPKTPLVTFQSGDLSTDDLNLFAKQCSHLVQEATDTGDTVEAALAAVSGAIQAAVAAATAAQTAISAVEAALADLAEQDLSAYSTTAQVVEMLGDYTPATRTVAAGDGIKINGGASATLGGTVTVGLDPATDPETVAGLLTSKATTPSGVHAAIVAALAGFAVAGIKNIRLITASGSVTPSAGVTKWVGFVVNGGQNGSSGGAGGNGGAGSIFIADVDPSQEYAATIGATGGATSVVIGGTTYTATNGVVNLPASLGEVGLVSSTEQEGGQGGAGPFGLGGAGRGGGPGHNPDASSGTGYGSGGGGAGYNSYAGNGAPGCLLIWEF